ncbi:MAG: helix-turn-helix transcriptional regulator [Actinobacteria bacterium]|nr:helix-turn-helix transcriptional regulator [Actinomycetota bacterium]
MITNEVQYRATKTHLDRFEDAAANLEREVAAGKRTKLQQLEIDAVRAQAEDLRAELREYERLRDGDTTVIEASSLAGLADALIQVRIARGWTQRQLADRLGVAEQQVQRYESSSYRSASLARLCDIAQALGVTFTQRAELHRTPADVA